MKSIKLIIALILLVTSIFSYHSFSKRKGIISINNGSPEPICTPIESKLSKFFSTINSKFLNGKDYTFKNKEKDTLMNSGKNLEYKIIFHVKPFGAPFQQIKCKVEKNVCF